MSSHRRFSPIELLESRVLLSGGGAVGRFITPIGGVPNRDWSVHHYVDANPAPGAANDFRGGPFSYDGHRGVDFSLPNFAAMDRGVAVLAAAAGTVVATHDGEFDRQTAQRLPAPPANYVVLDHGGGLRTAYYHLRKGSVGVKVGQNVEQGQKIGLVGSSGYTDGAHLHFETTLNGQTVDPFVSQYWAKSLPYAGDVHGVLDHGVTNYNPFPANPQDPFAGDEIEHISDVRTFKKAANVEPHAWLRLHNLEAGDTLEFRWVRPNGSIFQLQEFTAEQSYTGTGWWASMPLGSSPPTGTWQVITRWNNLEVARDTFAVTVSGAPEARLSQGSTYVIDGRTTAIDFGAAPGQSKTFTLLNHGSAPLAVTGVTAPAGYVVTDEPDSSIAPNSSDTFTLKFVGGSPKGRYDGSVVVRTNDVDEARYNFAVSGQIGGVSSPADTKRPVATLTAPRLNKAGRSDYTFTVTYADNVAVVPGTMDDEDLLVTGPGGFSRAAELVKVNRYKSGASRVATYRVEPPDEGGAWTRSNNGYYTVTLRAEQVIDTSKNAVPGGVLGKFRVLIPKAPAQTRPPSSDPVWTPFSVDALAAVAPWDDVVSLL